MSVCSVENRLSEFFTRVIYKSIFERFFQNEIPGTMVNQGSGIGLAITKEFIKMHGGSITVESEVNNGSSFIVYLPIPLVEEDKVQWISEEKSSIERPRKD